MKSKVSVTVFLKEGKSIIKGSVTCMLEGQGFRKKNGFTKKKRVGWGGGFDVQGFHLHHPNMKGKVSEKVTLKKGGGGIPCHQFICSYMQM